ncbi:MAG: hypothetical protein OXD44_11130 [Gammaproteobacteria bacterium]|nr:hypothetical protein [Gammaproteobacteria bacterium]
MAIYPTMDIAINKKNASGGESTGFRPYRSDPPEYYNEEFDLLKPNITQLRYVALPV